MEPVSEMEMGWDGMHWSGFLGTRPEVLGCAIHRNWIPIQFQSTQGELPRFGGGW